MSSIYQNDCIYDKHVYEKPYTYDNPYMSYDSAPERNKCLNHFNNNYQQKTRLTTTSTVYPQHSYRPVASVLPNKQHHRAHHEIIASAATLSTDLDLNPILRNSGHMSASMDRPHKQQSLSNKKSGFKASTIHGQQRGRPLPSVPSVIRNNNSFSTLNPSHRQRQQRNDIFSTAATLSSIHSTDSKGPLKLFWETPLYDITNSLSDSDSVGDTTTKTKSRSLCRCLTISVICLAIILLGVSLVAYFMVNKNFNLWDETQSTDDSNKYSIIGLDFLNNQQKEEILEKGSKIILGEFTVANRQYSTALKDSSSPEYEALTSDVIKSMDEMFLESALARIYNLTQVSNFCESDTTKGVVVKCKIALNIVLLTAAQEVGLTFINSLERRHGRLPAGNLRIDIRTIKFTVLSTASTSTDSTTTLVSNSISLPEENEEKSGSTDSPLVFRHPAYEESNTKGVHHQEKEEQNKRIDVNVMESKEVEQTTTITSTTFMTTSNSKAESKTEMKAFWSNWSEWSPCRGLNRDCDPGRIHSRIRKCMTDNGDVVNSDICRVNNGEQQELEIRDCHCTEKNKPGHVNTSEVNLTNVLIHTTSASQLEKPDRVCNDCKQNEICLLQVKAAVPFCAKIKDPRDPRGCGGWCSGHKELCRYVGAQTYQCVDDSECLEDEWQCANGLCIPKSRRCDGHFNCFDMSDEMYCECKSDEFHCGNKTSCLPLTQRCDGIIHCWDGEDEQNCTKVCTENQFTCNSGQCIPIESFCDSKNHCDDGTDEPDGCNASVCKSKDEFQCRNGRCVPRSALCDSIDNCGDYSDENDCKQISNNKQTAKQLTRPLRTAITDILSKRRTQTFH